MNLVAVVEETKDDQQILANEMVVSPAPDIDMPLIINHPIQVSGLAKARLRRAPELGEHMLEILRELGYDDEKISVLKREGALGG